MPAFAPIEIRLLMSKIAIGAPLTNGLFEFGIFSQNRTELYTAKNDANGLITFPEVRFSSPGQYNYTVKETSGPAEWDRDTREWPIQIKVNNEGGELHALLTYPDGVPVFVNKHRSRTCGLVEFPELSFTHPGVFEYTLRELTPSGGGWTTDDSEIKVIVSVVSDGHGNLVATISYPEGFPSFTDTHESKPAHIIINACKIAIGAPLPAGRFEFGLFDAAGDLISTATNGPADETH